MSTQGKHPAKVDVSVTADGEIVVEIEAELVHVMPVTLSREESMRIARWVLKMQKGGGKDEERH